MKHRYLCNRAKIQFSTPLSNCAKFIIFPLEKKFLLKRILLLRYRRLVFEINFNEKDSTVEKFRNLKFLFENIGNRYIYSFTTFQILNFSRSNSPRVESRFSFSERIGRIPAGEFHCFPSPVEFRWSRFSKRCTAPVSGSEYNFTSGRRFLDVGSSEVGVNDPLPNARMPSDAFLISPLVWYNTYLTTVLFFFFFEASNGNMNKLLDWFQEFFIVIWKTIFFFS